MGDTIAAIATGQQVSAIGIVRMSGKDSIILADKLFFPYSGGKLSDRQDRKLIYGELHGTEGELLDISGLYYVWENEEAIAVGPCSGVIGQAQDGETWAELCLWYDITPGLMYSLSVFTPDPDGLDLTAVAEQVYLPVQGND